MGEAEQSEAIEFVWGRKGARGGLNRGCQFYKSFRYDGVEYLLYDCVYLYKDGEPEPYIGKIIKIWEHRDKSRKVKVLWFFRPSEITNYIGDEEVVEKELFLASGDGVGLTNINPLEAIAGKCNVVCISKDSRNIQPSDEEVQMADYIYRRTFNVQQCKIMDELPEQISQIDIKSLLNRMPLQRPGGNVGALEKPGGDVDALEKPGGDVDALEKPGGNVDALPKPGGSVDALQKPGSNVVAPQKPVGNVDTPQKPRCDVDAPQKPGGSVDSPQKPCGNVDAPQEPGGNVDAPQKPCSNVNAPQKPGGNVDSPQKPGGIVDATVVPLDQNLHKENLAVKTNQTCIELDVRPSKKAKLDSSSESKDCSQKLRLNSDGNDTKILAPKLDSSYKSKDCIQKLRLNSDGNDTKVLAPTAPFTDDKSKLKSLKDNYGTDGGPSKKRKPDEKTTMVSDGKLTKESSIPSPHQNHKIDGQELKVTRRPQAVTDKSKWFAEAGSWEDRLRYTHQQGRLVLLQNLDPAYTSAEVEDIVYQGFKESCKAKMIQRTAFSSPHSGQAFVVFNTRQTAEAVVKKLEEGCLLLSNERPLLGRMRTPCLPEKKPKFFGHLVIDKLRSQMPREMKDAISTSHCSQPNTIEYDMAMEWCLSQERSDLTWKRLYKQQGIQMRKLIGNLKAKRLLRL